MRWSDIIWSSNFILRTDLWWHAFKININCCWKLESMEEKKKETSVHSYMLWFNLILGWDYIFFCFKLIIIHYQLPKNKRKYNLNQGQNWTTTYTYVHCLSIILSSLPQHHLLKRSKQNSTIFVIACLFVCLFVFVVSWNNHIGQNHLISGI